MKIAFYAKHHTYGGLANNGGTRTILKSIEALKKLGHEAFYVATVDKFTWFKHDKPKKAIPKDTDVCIAVSISDIQPMMKETPKTARVAYWGRPFESWQMNTARIHKLLKDFGGKIFVNSGWQQEELTRLKIKSEIIYNGVDFEDWEDQLIRDIPTIGFLYSSRDTKRWKDCEEIAKMLPAFRFVAFGNEKYSKPDWMATYLRRPKHEALVDHYSQCHIWFAPSKAEGFHNPPAEANLCGALVVCSGRTRNGMGDYARSDTAMVYDNLGEAIQMILDPDYERVFNMQILLRDKIGSREENMYKMVRSLS